MSIYKGDSNLFVQDSIEGMVEINPEFQPKEILELLNFKKNKANESITFEYLNKSYTIFRTEKRTWVIKENLNKIIEYARRSLGIDRFRF